MKRPYSKIDTSKLTKAQKEEHAKRLARVRKYTQVMREWKRKLKSGDIPKTMSLRDYRRGKSNPAPSMEQVQMESEDTIQSLRGDGSTAIDRINMLRRLLDEIEATERKKSELFEQVQRLA